MKQTIKRIRQRWHDLTELVPFLWITPTYLVDNLWTTVDNSNISVDKAQQDSNMII